MLNFCGVWVYYNHHISGYGIFTWIRTFLSTTLKSTYLCWTHRASPSSKAHSSMNVPFPESSPNKQTVNHYCRWKKSCTTRDVSNPAISGINYFSTGAGFLPSTAPPSLLSLPSNSDNSDFPFPFIKSKAHFQLRHRLSNDEIARCFLGRRFWATEKMRPSDAFLDNKTKPWLPRKCSHIYVMYMICQYLQPFTLNLFLFQSWP